MITQAHSYAHNISTHKRYSKIVLDSGLPIVDSGSLVIENWILDSNP